MRITPGLSRSPYTEMATIYAGIGNDKAYVFRRDFKEKRWDNVATGSKTCKVVFLKKNGTYYFKITPEDGTTPVIEFPLALENPITSSGQGCLQVPLPDQRMLYMIQFKDQRDALPFQAKMEGELNMKIPERGGLTTMPVGGAFPHAGGASVVLPAPILPDNPSLTQGPFSQPPMPVTGASVGLRAQQVPLHQQQIPRAGGGVHPQSPQQAKPACDQPDFYQPGTGIPPQGAGMAPQGARMPPQGPGMAPQGAGMAPQGARMPPQGPGMVPQGAGMAPQGARMPPQGHGMAPQGYQVPYQAPYAQQPVSAATQLPVAAPATMPPPLQPIPRAQLPPAQAQPYLYQGPFSHTPQQQQAIPRAQQGYGPMQAKPKILGASPPIQRKQPLPPDPPPSQNIHNLATFLSNAINTGNSEAAKDMIDILTSSELKDKKGAFTVTFDEKEQKAKEKKFTLEVQIEFQASNKNQLPVFLDVTENLSIDILQQMVELQFRIPKVTQNWIIGPKLVKSAELQTTLKELGVTGTTDKAKVFLYVMHAKKAGVTEEELARIKQRQQQAHRQQLLATQRPSELHTPQESVYERLGPRGYQPTVSQQQQLATGQIPQRFSTQQYPQAPQLPPKQRAMGVYFEQTGEQAMNLQGGIAVTRGAIPPAHTMDAPVEQTLPLKDRGVPPDTASSQQAFVGYPNQNPADPNAQLDGPAPDVPAPDGPAPDVPKEEPKKEEKVGWVCVGCTFINRPRRPGCEQCGTARPPDYIIPADCPPDESELRILKQQEENDKLFLEFKQLEQQKHVVERQENFRALMEAEEADLNPNTEAFDCPICFVRYEPGEGVTLRGCLHQFCKECLHDCIKLGAEAEVQCPFQDDDYKCEVPIAEREIRGLVTEEELEELYRRGLRQAESAAPNSFHCRTPNCGGFCFYEDEVNEFDCPICVKKNCLTCKAIHEGMDCREYQEDLKRLAENDAAAKATQEMLEQLVRNGDAMHCPSCKIVVQKKDGCDWIKCSVCKTEICWATKGPRWGPGGRKDTSGGCRCRVVAGKKCHPLCRNCH